MTKDGITLHGRGAPDGIRAYGAWMAHSGFQVSAAVVDTLTFWYGMAGGDATGARPTAPSGTLTLTYNGVMVGMPSAGGKHVLQGTASGTYTLADQDLDLAFSDIYNLDTGAAWSGTTPSWSDVAVDSEGKWTTGSGSSSMSGAFYGTGAPEAAGVFRHSGIIGAYGMKKQ